VQPQRFLIISSPETHNVYYAALPSLHDLTQPLQSRAPIEAKVLIDGLSSRCSGTWCYEDSDRGLLSPAGIAVQQGCGKGLLYVSDTQIQDLFVYDLSVGVGGSLLIGPQRRVRQGIAGEAEWLAVDGLGNLFLTAPQKGQVGSISSSSLFSGSNLSEPATVLFDASGSPSVAAPAGVASDGFFVYWANQNGDSTAGTLARGPQRVAAATERLPEPAAISTGAYEARASNVCLARDSAFYTGETASLFGVKIQGVDAGNVTEISHELTQPRGCAYDGESTLYVADHGADAVYSLAANMLRLRKVRQLAKVVSVQRPSQLAVFAGATSGRCPRQSLPSRAHVAGRPGVMTVALSAAVAMCVASSAS